ncbi:MAG TPA: isoaspartyl peptidase/L-asparaginase [Candidatus Dormibacteraeota bacterium]|nr:isoaspartyl peptidase/L-asparaginase [Candidatus Dormibacteraeota bacterium]
MRPSLIVHGGAWDIPDESVAECREGCRQALEAGWKLLAAGGAALDAIEAAMITLEDNSMFDAGIGSHLNRDGQVELDAIVMDAQTLRAGAVAAVQRIRNPIRLARAVLESCEHMMLVGAGAEKFAVERGFELCDPNELIIERERAAWARCLEDRHAAKHHRGHEAGTVGAVAMDQQGNLFAATSTGGTCCKRPGRVGDSPLIGCGCYADREAGAVSCTGWGEAIMKIVMAKTTVELLRASYQHDQEALPLAGNDDPTHTARTAVCVLAERGRGTGGLILLDRNGRPGFAHNTPRMAYGYVAEDGSFITET